MHLSHGVVLGAGWQLVNDCYFFRLVLSQHGRRRALY
mgnify:CR=1 FL=1